MCVISTEFFSEWSLKCIEKIKDWVVESIIEITLTKLLTVCGVKEIKIILTLVILI